MAETAVDTRRYDLTVGDITGKLLNVSLPIIGTQVMLTGYNLVDMFLLGRVGSDAVAASGSAGMYMWLSAGLMLVGRMGAEIGVAQRKGRHDYEGAVAYSRNSLFLAVALSLVFAAACLGIPHQLIAFLNIQEANVAQDAADYLWIIGLGIPALFIASSISGTFTGSGNSRIPFYVNAVGLVLNAVLDPLFIFTFGMGVRGAAWATIIAQWVNCGISVYYLFSQKHRPFLHYSLRVRPARNAIRQILRWTVPVSIENLLFTFFTMVVARQIAVYGADAITVYRVGSQAESLCWLICLGFSSGITAFVGQNFGAGKWSRIWKGVRLGLVVIVIWGVIVTVLFSTSGRWLTGLFVPEDGIMAMGRDYLLILSICQIPFCLESVGAGAFRGLGRTLPPSSTSVFWNLVRVPIVHVLSASALGLNGVWVGITVTATMRGLCVFGWFLLDARRRPKTDQEPPVSIRLSETPSAVAMAEAENKSTAQSARFLP